MPTAAHRVLNVILAGCALAATVAASATAATEAIVYSFEGGSDGGVPAAGLVNVGGTLYGTTTGAPTTTYRLGDNCGTVFSVTQAGVEKVLHAFPCASGSDGEFPYAALINVRGTLYGTTSGGGAFGYGTVFSITRAGVEKVLYSFGNNGANDGVSPFGSLIYVDGTFYGTTYGGGANGSGTVFSVTPGGVETVLHSFGGGSDGAVPQSGLIDVNGTLYGTTGAGGANGDGTVFSITLAGVETVLHSFNRSDGYGPVGGLVYVGGILYGTTEAGGTFKHCSDSCGTVFSLTPAGVETVLHSFGGFPGGRRPAASLLAIADQLYGTTLRGGAIPSAQKGGTVFSVIRGGPHAGLTKLLHSFFGTNDGVNPSGIIDVGGTFYGVTAYGGAYGHGTVFKVTP